MSVTKRRRKAIQRRFWVGEMQARWAATKPCDNGDHAKDFIGGRLTCVGCMAEAGYPLDLIEAVAR